MLANKYRLLVERKRFEVTESEGKECRGREEVGKTAVVALEECRNGSYQIGELGRG